MAESHIELLAYTLYTVIYRKHNHFHTFRTSQANFSQNYICCDTWWLLNIVFGIEWNILKEFYLCCGAMETLLVVTSNSLSMKEKDDGCSGPNFRPTSETRSSCDRRKCE